MTDSTPRFRWGWPGASRVLACLGMICFIVLLCGGHLGSVNLVYLGWALLAAAWVVG